MEVQKKVREWTAKLFTSSLLPESFRTGAEMTSCLKQDYSNSLIFIGSINHKPGAEDTEMNKTNPCYDGAYSPVGKKAKKGRQIS